MDGFVRFVIDGEVKELPRLPWGEEQYHLEERPAGPCPGCGAALGEIHRQLPDGICPNEESPFEGGFLRESEFNPKIR